jgi:hypothetical protein
MGVYLDSIDIPYRSMIMCHMVADTTEELLFMVDKIGVARKWIQYPGTVHEHFDICKSKKSLALKHGAQQITLRQMAEFLKKRRESNSSSPFKTII